MGCFSTDIQEALCDRRYGDRGKPTGGCGNCDHGYLPVYPEASRAVIPASDWRQMSIRRTIIQHAKEHILNSMAWVTDIETRRSDDGLADIGHGEARYSGYRGNGRTFDGSASYGCAERCTGKISYRRLILTATVGYSDILRHFLLETRISRLPKKK